ncbi:PolC-type DNA polymerase III [Feifania hominis]|uniref:DNA polymerase III PolC-type n=1 Tax=Feifania hominis TaxID=2763660 RepID=A0A926DBS3_9FIRM|nr:PolC-type DNA polymerase III [Feifania hominis]MBC8535643.1 PolC-type DNA polymerase III [Feifania hominis]
MNAKFLEVFCEYHPEGSKRELLESAVLTDVKMDIDNKTMSFSLEGDRLFARSLLDEIAEDLKSLYGLRESRLAIHYPAELFSEQYYGELCSYCVKHVGACNGFLTGSTARYEKGLLTISLTHGGEAILKSAKLADTIAQLVRDEFSLSIRVTFDGVLETDTDSGVYREIREQEQRADEQISKTFAAQRRAAPAPAGARRAGAQGGALLGRPINTEPMRMADIRIDTGTATIQGDVFAIETKDTRDGKKKIFTISITDYTSSINLKSVLPMDKAEALLEVLHKNDTVKVRGSVSFDSFDDDLVIWVNDIEPAYKRTRTDDAEEKRIELHLHTNMSSMDALTSVSRYIERAKQWGHEAVVITDHGVAQAFPEAMKAQKATGYEGKIIYGMEAYFVNDIEPAVHGDADTPFDGTFVVFDVETTGLNPTTEALTEIGAVRLKGGEIVEQFNTFVNPQKPIPAKITQLTGITDAMVADAPPEGEALKSFLEFAGDSPLVAHNAGFDMSFLRAAAERTGQTVANTYIDTLVISRSIFRELKKHKLDTIVEYLKLGSFNHHRACDDALILAKVFLKMMERIREDSGADRTDQINQAIAGNIDVKKARPYHQILLVKNYTGLKNLYQLISDSNLKYFGGKTPRIPKSELIKHREGLIVGSACEAGELFRAIVDKREWGELLSIADFYDYLEIQPICNNMFLIASGKAENVEQLREFNRTVIRIADKLNKPVVATGDVHYIDPGDEIFRRILLNAQGFSDADKELPLYYRTTNEMLREFDYLGEELARKVVIENPKQIAALCEQIRPVPKESFPPEIEGAEQELVEITLKRAREIYGDPLPPIVQERLDKELNSITKNGFSVLYMIAQKLVSQSLADGFLVGSRGSVGSSLVAYLSGITEVNSLCPHYVCPNCKKSEFITDASYETGADMPPKDCPDCGTPYIKQGFDIPFETFLGFDGDKAPDIDLNFSGDYQATAHRNTEKLFGKDYVFRAGTIGTLAEKTAYGYVLKYVEERGLNITKAEKARLAAGCMGVKRTTGQHPGGLIVMPKYKEITDFCPIQHPADDPNSTIITTHFDYHSIDQNLLKLDLLAHDDPTAIRMLEDITGIDAKKIPLDDPETQSLFYSNESLGIEGDEITSSVGALGLPEFGTKFVRQMLEDTRPHTFGELIRISGLSHGTDVWVNNAQDLVTSQTATLKDCICTRDDIMLYLIHMGMDKKESFTIMEAVRKGKGLKPEWEQDMRAANVPEWYIDSCKKIKYMFPKAHAAAYVTMAFRIAWFKVHRPAAFYATYFTVRADDFDSEYMIHGLEKVKSRLLEIKANPKASNKEKDQIPILEACYEMYRRGINFRPIDLYGSHATKFLIVDGDLLPPLNSLAGVASNAAMAIMEERERGTFMSIEELLNRTKVTKTVIEALQANRILEGMPESAQMTLF